MAIIEMLEFTGILNREFHETEKTSTWELGMGHEHERYLCMDGLSLDRHRYFKKKLKRHHNRFRKTSNSQ